MQFTVRWQTAEIPGICISSCINEYNGVFPQNPGVASQLLYGNSGVSMFFFSFANSSSGLFSLVIDPLRSPSCLLERMLHPSYHNSSLVYEAAVKPMGLMSRTPAPEIVYFSTGDKIIEDGEMDSLLRWSKDNGGMGS